MKDKNLGNRENQMNHRTLVSVLHPHVARVAIAITFAAIACAMPAPTFGVIVSALNGDFNNLDPSPTYSGTAAAIDSGTFWNALNGSSVGVMTNSDGITASPITVSITGNSGVYYYGAFGTQPSPALLNDGAMENTFNQSAALTFNGVPTLPGGSYDLYLYSVNSVNYNSISDFTLGAVTHTVSNSGASTWVLGDNYTLFSGLTPVAGVIAVTWTDKQTLPATLLLNGFQLVAMGVPEPSTVLLLLGGGLLVWRSRRRQS
ncbi:PEP-CTERM sorting domain-containing protein [bacterium]|nr:PEP-CTERM sorting domain-containing protein [bacterium]